MTTTYEQRRAQMRAWHKKNQLRLYAARRMRIQMLVDAQVLKAQQRIDEHACDHTAKIEHPVELQVHDPPFMDVRARCDPRDMVEEFEDWLGGVWGVSTGLLSAAYHGGGHAPHRRRKVR